MLYKKEREKKKEERVKLAGGLEKFFEQHRAEETPNAPTPGNSGCTPSISTSITVTEKKVQHITEDSTLPRGQSEEDTAAASRFTVEVLFDNPGTSPDYLSSYFIYDLITRGGPKQIKNIKFPVDANGKKFSSSYFYKTLVNRESIITRGFVIQLK